MCIFAFLTKDVTFVSWPAGPYLEKAKREYLARCLNNGGRTPEVTQQTGDAATAASLLFFLANAIGACGGSCAQSATLHRARRPYSFRTHS